MPTQNKPVGQTASVGFQIGVRRTLPISRETAWAFLTSPEGLKLWLGDIASGPEGLQAGRAYTSAEGNAGEIRIVKPYEQLRLTWQKSGWSKPSTLQIRLLSSTDSKTTISFHQEKLDGSERLVEMKRHWEEVLAIIEKRYQ